MLQKITYFILLFTVAFVIPVFSNQSLDTIKTKNGIKEEWVIKDKVGNTKEIIRLKSGLKDGMQEVFYQNGKKSEESNYSNGFLNGTKFIYNTNGDITSKITYKYVPAKKRSLPNGDFETYSNKNLITKGTFKDSLSDGKYEEFHANGNIKLKATYKSGLLTGLFSEYRISGEIYSERNYLIITENGNPKSILNGSCKFYQQINKLTEEGFYLNNKKDGVWKSYNEGELYKSVTYKNNLQHGEVIEYKKGKLRKKYNYYQEYNNDGVILTNIMDGRLEEYYDNGNISKIENYKKGKRHGFFEEYFDNKNYKSKSEYQNGIQIGKQEYWDVNGNKTYEAEFKITVLDGVEKSIKNGKELRWEKGVLTYEVQFVDGVEIGVSKSYHPNGKLMRVSSIKNGRYDGRYLEYHDNGELKSDLTYKTFTDKSGSLKSIQIGWRTEYDRNGKYLNRYYHDTLGEISIYMNYYKGIPMNITYKDIFTMEFFPDGKLMSFLVLGAHYSGSYGHYFYWNGKTRKMKVQNSENNILNSINFSDSGEPTSSYSDMHHNPVEKRLDENAMKKYAKTINPDLIQNPLFSDTILNGKYQLHFSGNKLMGEMNFKNGFPEGDFLFFDPVGKDTLSFSQFSGGNKTGYYVHKFGGKTVYKRGRMFENGQLAWNENYQTNGLPYSKATFDKSGKRIINIEYFENGKMKYSNNEITGDYASYDLTGSILSEVKQMDEVKKIKIHSEYFPGTSLLKSVHYTTNGVRDSLWENYFQNGQLQFRYAYNNGKKNGPCETYNDQGKLISKGNFVDDKQDGYFEQMKDGKMETMYYEKGNLKVLPSSVACVCQDTKESLSTTTFAPPVDQLISYSRLLSFLPDNIVPEDSVSFSKIFYTAFQNSSSRDGGFYSMNFMMFQPHYFKIPSDEQIKITLNPCHTQGYRSRLETRINVTFSDDNETTADFYPERISLEFLKSPMKSGDKNISDFKAYFNTKEVSISRNRKLEMDFEFDNKDCYSDGIIYNFLKVKIAASTPLLFKDPKEFIGTTVNNLNLSDAELKKFFGLYVTEASCSFPITVDKKIYDLNVNSNFMLVGGTYVAGELRIACSKDGNELEVETEKGKVKFTVDDVKSQWLNKGFTKLSVDFNEEKKELIIRFFAE